jgi:hypothetical protein
MWNPGHQHAELLLAIEAAGGVPCASLPEVFFPEDIADPNIRQTAILTAKALCSTCPVKWQCFEYATTTGQTYGIWAGTLPHER